jgi:hypothetical protein
MPQVAQRKTIRTDQTLQATQRKTIRTDRMLKPQLLPNCYKRCIGCLTNSSISGRIAPRFEPKGGWTQGLQTRAIQQQLYVSVMDTSDVDALCRHLLLKWAWRGKVHESPLNKCCVMNCQLHLHDALPCGSAQSVSRRDAYRSQKIHVHDNTRQAFVNRIVINQLLNWIRSISDSCVNRTVWSWPEWSSAVDLSCSRTVWRRMEELWCLD